MLPILTIALAAFLQQPIDATALTITLERDSFSVRVGRWTLRTKKAAEMNRFVDLHQKEIDPEKVFLCADEKASFEEFDPALKVFKKHPWWKWRLKVIPKASPVRPVDLR
jgi:hypothetical protein